MLVVALLAAAASARECPGPAPFAPGELSLPARNLGPAVNSEGDDFHPTLGPRHRLVFVRRVWEPLTPSDFWWVDTRCLDLDR